MSLMFKGERGGYQVFNPVFSPEFGLEQEAGPVPIRGEITRCKTKIRTQKIQVDGKAAELRELVLECNEGRRFVVRAVNFEVKE